MASEASVILFFGAMGFGQEHTPDESEGRSLGELQHRCSPQARRGPVRATPISPSTDGAGAAFRRNQKSASTKKGKPMGTVANIASGCVVQIGVCLPRADFHRRACGDLTMHIQ
jgi:hypothetical protein